MQELNLHDNNATIEVLAPVRATATANGTGIDMRDYIGKMKFILSSSAGGGTTPTLDVKLQECDTSGGTYTDISGATFTQVTDAADSTEDLGLAIDGVKRYVRAVETITGTSPTFDRALLAIGRKQVV